MRRLFALLCLLLCSLTAGCLMPQPEPKWIEGDVKVSSERVLWDLTRMALEQNKFPVGAGLDPTRMVAESGWMHSLAPFRGKGFRERCHIEWKRVAEGHWTLRVRVERERNDDITHPLDVSYADWQPDPDDEDRAKFVTQYIRSMLATVR
jgi:hypothetical protein